MILKDRKSGQSITLFWAKYHHHTICIKFLGNLYLSQECCKRVKEFYTKFDFFLKKRKIQLIKWLLPIMEKQFMWHTTEFKLNVSDNYVGQHFCHEITKETGLGKWREIANSTKSLLKLRIEAIENDQKHDFAGITKTEILSLNNFFFHNFETNFLIISQGKFQKRKSGFFHCFHFHC